MQVTSFQVAKDTFYATLRDRVALGNAARVVLIRGVLRPGVVVVENELPGAAVDGIAPVDAFSLRWGATTFADGGTTGRSGPALVAMVCEVRYATDGSTGATGMDRGRALTAMDAELAVAVTTEPRAAAAIVVGAAAATGLPAVFWGDVTFGAVVMRGERMERTAEIEVWSYA